MTPVRDWTRFDAIRDAVKARHDEAKGENERRSTRYLWGRLADARHALELGRPWVMSAGVKHPSAPPVTETVHTPDEFADAWERGFRP